MINQSYVKEVKDRLNKLKQTSSFDDRLILEILFNDYLKEGSNYVVSQYSKTSLTESKVS
jgi:hypothetical protein